VGGEVKVHLVKKKITEQLTEPGGEVVVLA